MRIIVKIKVSGKWGILTYAVEKFDITNDIVNYHIKGSDHDSREFVKRIDRLWLDGVMLIDKRKLV